MFCPKCGGENPTELAYCRSCGENLTLINQVMKGHAPVALISRIDSVLDTGYERLRRDAILWSLWAVVWVVIFFMRFLGFDWSRNPQALVALLVFSLTPAGFMSILAGWNFLLFRRAKRLAHNAASRLETDLDVAFCPRCGIDHDRESDFCSDCGFDMSVLDPQEHASYLTRELDDALLERLNTPGRTVRGIIIEAVAWSGAGLFTASADLLNGGFYLLLAISRTAVNVWDYVHFTRKAKTSTLVPDQLLADLSVDSEIDEGRVRRRKRTFEVLMICSLVIFVLIIIPIDIILLGQPRPQWLVWLQLASSIVLFFTGWRGQIVQRRILAKLALAKDLRQEVDQKAGSADLLPDVAAEHLITSRLSESTTRKLRR